MSVAIVHSCLDSPDVRAQIVIHGDFTLEQWHELRAQIDAALDVYRAFNIHPTGAECVQEDIGVMNAILRGIRESREKDVNDGSA
jgi:hypothetical protein